MKKLYILLSFLLIAENTSAFEISLDAHFDTLSNGLKVLMVKDEDVPVVSCRLYYFVGSMYEGPGTSGLSHMYEHMMFKGTKTLGTKDFEKEKPIMKSIDSIDVIIGNLRSKGYSENDSIFKLHRDAIFSLLDMQREFIKKDEIWETYQSAGGTGLNAWTGDDITAYIVTLPKNKTELFYWIESDRMENPILREFYSERDVVTEERRMRYDNKPVNKYWEMLAAKFYSAHPYRLPTIGWMSDIRAYTREKMSNHIKRYYTPDNGMLILVGNINPEEELKKIKSYFEKIPRAAKPKDVVVTKEPAAIGETRFTVHDNAQQRIDILFQIPGFPNNDLYSLDVIEGILSGRSGRLYNRIVKQDAIGTGAGGSCSYKFDTGYFHVWATFKNGTDPKKVEDALIDELNKLKQNSPSKNEMERVKNSINMHFIKKLKSLEGLSDQLAFFELYGGWEGMLNYPGEIAKIKSENIPAIATTYFNKELSTTGLLLSKDIKEKNND